jgi:hypothetical protein
MILAMSDRAQRWLLLLHQIPPTPPYFRAKVLRRLNQVGALAIKNSAYVLPEAEETTEDLEWLRSEIAEQGGEAWLFRTETVSGFADGELAESFRSARNQEYIQLLDECKQLLAGIIAAPADAGKREIDRRRLKRRFDEIRRIDFFSAPAAKEVEEVMEAIAQTVKGTEAVPASKPDLTSLRGRTWVTRRGIKVDRIGSAWLIRRFVDSAAQFQFVDPDRYAHHEGDVRFDMFEGEFTHDGDRCTFEVLLAHAGLSEPALEAIGQIVHDIDLKEDKYQRPETGGIAAQIAGIAALHASDEARLEDGCRVFEVTYAGLRATKKS